MGKEKKTNKIIIQANTRIKEIGDSPIELYRDDPNVLDLAVTRIADYHQICEEFDIKPTIEGLALAFGTDRKTLTAWYQKEVIWVNETHVQEVLAQEWQFINACHITGMEEGTIDKVVGIFVGKNNFGYTNEDPEPKRQDININISAAQLIEEAKNLQIKGQ